MAQQQVLEGPWKEVQREAEALDPEQRVRLLVLPPTETTRQEEADKEISSAYPSRISEEFAKLDQHQKVLKAMGMFAHVPGGSEEFMREKQAEIDWEDRKFD